MKADLPRREPVRLARWHAEDLYGADPGNARGRSAFPPARRPALRERQDPHRHGDEQDPEGPRRAHARRSRASTRRTCRAGTATACPSNSSVDKELGPKKRGMSDVAIRQACRKFAEKWIDVQRADFKRLGILGRWEAPYRTMDFSYQAEIARAFGGFVDRGLVTFGFKSVLWCVRDRTALAEAEIEYEDRTDPSIYVAMPLEEKILRKARGGPPSRRPARRASTPSSGRRRPGPCPRTGRSRSGKKSNTFF